MWRRRIVWLLLILAAAALYLFENGGGTLAVLLSVVLVPPLCVLPSALGAKRSEITISAPERASCGSEIRAVIRSRARGEAVFRVKNLHTGEETEQRIFLNRESTDVTVESTFCGALRLSVSDLVTRDLFGLTERKLPVQAAAETLVLPELFQPEVLLAESGFAMPDSSEYSAVKPGSDPSETFGIREYRPGDSIKTIHWKLSQKSVDTVVRELSLPVEHQVLLRYQKAEPGATAPAMIHSMTTLLLSLSSALSDQGVIHDASWFGEVDSEEARLAALDALLSLEPTAPNEMEVHTGGSHAHVAVAAAEPVTGLADQYNGSRVTVLTPGVGAEGLQSDGTYLLCFDRPEQLGRIEL